METWQQARRRGSSRENRGWAVSDPRGRDVEGLTASNKPFCLLSFQGEDPELVLESVPGFLPTAAFISPGHISWGPTLI